MKEFVAITSALADESRVRILGALKNGERCVCQVNELLDLAPSTVSRHLAVLKHAGLIDVRKEGRWLYYCIADAGAPSMVREAIRWVFAVLAKDKTLAQDAKRLSAILKMEPEVLCCRQRALASA